MITLDASVVIAHLCPLDPHHQAATEYLRGSAELGFVIHSLNLTEVLVGGVKAGRGQEMLTDLKAIGIVVADRRDGEPLRLANLRASSGLKLPNCCALDTALTTASTLATFDDALAKAAPQHHVTVAPDDPKRGRFVVPLSAENRAAAGVTAGQQLEVDIEADTAPREVDVPADLADALAHDSPAKYFFDALSYTHRKEWVRWIKDAKKPNTRSARVAKTVAALRAGESFR